MIILTNTGNPEGILAPHFSVRTTMVAFSRGATISLNS